LDEASLSAALLSVAGGAVLCLLVAGRIIGRLGARRSALLGATVLCAALGLLLVFDRYAGLITLMLVFGASVGLYDVAINTEGTHIEERLGRKVMSTMHGMWSLGGMVGAAVGAALLKAQVDPLLQLRGAALVCALLAWAAGLRMLPAHAPVHASVDVPGPAPAPAGERGATRVLLTLGGLAILGLLAEGAMYDWSVLYLQQELHAAPAVAALGYASFSAAMAATRFVGDRLRSRVAAGPLLAASAALSASAMAVVLLSGHVGVALAGFALVGVGFANVVPILFVAAARVPGVAGATGIATVSSLGYFGMVAGPPLVGGIAQLSTLSWGLAVVVLASLLLAAGARRVS
jgi:fucose permease